MKLLNRFQTTSPVARRPRAWLLALVLLQALLLALSLQAVAAHPAEQTVAPAVPMHPRFTLLDAAGAPVLDSGQPVSTLSTCGECHDTAFITQHTSHTGLAADHLPLPGEDGAARMVDGLEMNCFLCHTANPNAQAYFEAVEAGGEAMAWASTAALIDSGVITHTTGTYSYVPAAFEEDGTLRPDVIGIQDPTNRNCGQCHGTVHNDLSVPLTIEGFTAQDWRAASTGQVVSPQRLSASGLNLADKQGLNRTFDVHAERMVSCTDCHYSLNNPVYTKEEAQDQPAHLTFDPRRLELDEYLQTPVHEFARSDAAGAARECQECHSLEATHDWLPYKARHTQAMSCETCHAPKLYAPAFQEIDWTVLHTDASPRLRYRGVEGGGDNAVRSLVRGYEPALLAAADNSQVAPYNLVTTWYWAAGTPPQPVGPDALQAAWLENGGYAPEVLATFDVDGDASLSEAELFLDSQAKVDLIAARLQAQGLQAPSIQGEVKAYAVHHSLAADEWATRDCRTCHSENSQLAQRVELSPAAPGGATPTWVSNPDVRATGLLVHSQDGGVYYQPAVEKDNLYVFGHSAVWWIDLLGGLAFLGVIAGVGTHGGLRYRASRRNPLPKPALKRVYMYAVYERLWHWLQTLTILGLLFTGLVIHRPDTFGIFSFRYVVLVHNVLAVILLSNAALSLFYHLVSGEIQQYLPKPAGFIDQAIEQATYYLKGIFQGAPHPFEKRREKKLNPLQQVTYFGILNVLLPLQIITGALMWGVQRWPDLAARFGGLPFLAPAHSLVAWLFAAFIVAHVYLTTTGHKPLASIQAMMVGWDEVETAHGEMDPGEVHHPEEPEAGPRLNPAEEAA